MKIGITQDDFAPAVTGGCSQGVTHQLLEGFTTTETPYGQRGRYLGRHIGVHLDLLGLSQA